MQKVYTSTEKYLKCIKFNQIAFTIHLCYNNIRRNKYQSWLHFLMPVYENLTYSQIGRFCQILPTNTSTMAYHMLLKIILGPRFFPEISKIWPCRLLLRMVLHLLFNNLTCEPGLWGLPGVNVRIWPESSQISLWLRLCIVSVSYWCNSLPCKLVPNTRIILAEVWECVPFTVTAE